MKNGVSFTRHITVRLGIILLFVAIIGFVGVFFNSFRTMHESSEKLRLETKQEIERKLKFETEKVANQIKFEHKIIINSAKNKLKSKVTFIERLLKIGFTDFQDKQITKEDMEQYFTKFDFIKNINIIFKDGTYAYNFANNVVLDSKTISEELKFLEKNKEGFLNKDFINGSHLVYIKLLDKYGLYIRAEIQLKQFIDNAIKNILEHISKLKISRDGNGYFFINTMQGDIVVSHGKVYYPPLKYDTLDIIQKKAIKTNLDNLNKNPNGYFYNHIWKELDNTEVNSLSYSVIMPSANFILGLAYNLDKFEKILKEKHKTLEQEIIKRFLVTLAVFSICVIIFWFFVIILVKKLNKDLNIFFKFINDAENKYTEINPKKIKFLEFRKLAVSINNFINTIQNKQDEVLQNASRDYLTGLPNKMLLDDKMSNYIEQARIKQNKIGVYFVDLDLFKLINDSLGHAKGDLVLKEVASILLNILGKNDELLRIGGDEFIVILNNVVSREAIESFAKRLLEELNTEIKIFNDVLKISVSIGISIYPDNGKQANALIRCADIAMYEAKNAGRNIYKFFHKKMDEKIYEIVVLEKEIGSAIEKNEFVLFYQPKISLKTGKIIGAEALIRWQHPTKGLIFPDSFIGVAERTNLINKLGEWILNEGCKQQEAWEKAGYNLKIALNLSVKQLESRKSIEIIKKILEKYNINIKNIEFEITESFSANEKNRVEIIQSLKALGLSLAIDDFGTGYSSLSYLNKLPMDIIKIDRSFITGMLDEPNKKTLVEVIIQTAKILKKTTVAEGVETKEDMLTLAELGCDEYQGYYFSKPVPLEIFNKYLEHLNEFSIDKSPMEVLEPLIHP